MANGLTTEKMVERMYTEMVGLDGAGGMVQDIKKASEGRKVLHGKVEVIEKTMVTKDYCKNVRDTNHRDEIDPPSQKKRRAVLATRLLEVTIMGAVISAILGLLKIFV